MIFNAIFSGRKKQHQLKKWNFASFTSATFQTCVFSRVIWTYGEQLLLCQMICGIPSHDDLPLIYRAGVHSADTFSREKYVKRMSEHYPTRLGQMFILPTLLLPQRAIPKCCTGPMTQNMYGIRPCLACLCFCWVNASDEISEKAVYNN